MAGEKEKGRWCVGSLVTRAMLHCDFTEWLLLDRETGKRQRERREKWAFLRNNIRIFLPTITVCARVKQLNALREKDRVISRRKIHKLFSWTRKRIQKKAIKIHTFFLNCIKFNIISEQSSITPGPYSPSLLYLFVS